MLPTTPSFERLALNRATFGARSVDEAYAQNIGWETWVNEQLSPPPGDDPAVAGLIANATLKIKYSAKSTADGGWGAVDEERPLTALNASPLALWDIYEQRNKTLPNKEVYRIAEEVVAAAWMRANHSAYQVRELMVDFWHNHFNVAITQSPAVATGTAAYDRDVIRPHVFGNFRDMLEANATSVSMLYYLDNAISKPAIPNENYARELLELHTLGEDVYFGQTDPASVTKYASGIAIGFTDEDVVQASRALSGWTVGSGSRLARFQQPVSSITNRYCTMVRPEPSWDKTSRPTQEIWTKVVRYWISQQDMTRRLSFCATKSADAYSVMRRRPTSSTRPPPHG